MENTWNKEVENMWNTFYLPTIVFVNKIGDPFAEMEYKSYINRNKLDQSYIDSVLYYYKNIETKGHPEKISETNLPKKVAMKLWIENNRNKKLDSLLK